MYNSLMDLNDSLVVPTCECRIQCGSKTFAAHKVTAAVGTCKFGGKPSIYMTQVGNTEEIEIRIFNIRCDILGIRTDVMYVSGVAYNSITDKKSKVYGILVRFIYDLEEVNLIGLSDQSVLDEFCTMYALSPYRQLYPVFPIVIYNNDGEHSVLLGNTKGLSGTLLASEKHIHMLTGKDKCPILFTSNGYGDSRVPVFTAKNQMYLVDSWGYGTYLVAVYADIEHNIDASRVIMHRVTNDLLFVIAPKSTLNSFLRDTFDKPLKSVNSKDLPYSEDDISSDSSNLRKYFAQYNIPKESEYREIKRLHCLFKTETLTELDAEVVRLL